MLFLQDKAVRATIIEKIIYDMTLYNFTLHNNNIQHFTTTQTLPETSEYWTSVSSYIVITKKTELVSIIQFNC